MKKTIKNNTTILDWLELNFTCAIQVIEKTEKIRLDNNTILKYSHINNNENWHNIDELYINNRLIATIKHNPKTKFLKRTAAKLKFENELLYTGKWFDYFQYIVNHLKWNYEGIFIVHIANDSFGNNIMKFLDVYINEKNKRIKSINPIIKNSRLNINRIDNDSNIKFPFMIGSSKSNRQIEIYLKLKELEATNKQYIRDFWKANNLNYKNNEIERFELKLKRKQAENLNIFKLLDENYLNQILKENTNQMFRFTRKRKNRNGKTIVKDVTPIIFNPKQEKINYIKPEKIKRETNSIAKKKTSIKALYMDYLSTNNINQQNILLDAILIQIGNNEYLEDWFMNKSNFWIKEANKTA